MAQKREANWQKRLYDVDFTIIRTQMAREQGVPITRISEADVQRRVEALQKEYARVYARAHPRGPRPQRAGK